MSYARQGFVDGALGTLGSLASAFRPSNIPHATRQVGDLAHVLMHPIQNGRAASHALEAVGSHVDVRATTARTLGDIAGSAAVVAGVTMAGTAILRRPYLGSSVGRYLARSYQQMPLLSIARRPVIRNFVITRPLAMAVGTGVSTASLMGGANERHSTAEENRLAHPVAADILERQRLHELLATPLSRVVNNSR